MNVFWTPIHNVGDDLTPYLVKGLFNQNCILSRKSPKWLLTGSILHYAGSGDTLAGCGSFKDSPCKNDLSLDIRFVRGPLTAKHLKRTDLLYGDAGMLMPLVYNPIVEKKYNWGIVVHFMDNLKIPDNIPNTLLLSPRLDPKMFINQMLQCKYIMSSSLHGIILAEAYGIPACRLAAGVNSHIIDFDFRNADYYEGTNRDLPTSKTYEILLESIPNNPPDFTSTIRKMIKSIQKEIVIT